MGQAPEKNFRPQMDNDTTHTNIRQTFQGSKEFSGNYMSDIRQNGAERVDGLRAGDVSLDQRGAL